MDLFSSKSTDNIERQKFQDRNGYSKIHEIHEFSLENFMGYIVQRDTFIYVCKVTVH